MVGGCMIGLLCVVLGVCVRYLCMQSRFNLCKCFLHLKCVKDGLVEAPLQVQIHVGTLQQNSSVSKLKIGARRR